MCMSCDATFIPFTAQTRMSGVNFDGRQIRKGAADAIEDLCARSGRRISRPRARTIVEQIAKQGGTPLVVAEGPQARWASSI